MLTIRNAADAVEEHYRYVDWVKRNETQMVDHWTFLDVSDNAAAMNQEVIRYLQTSEIAFVTDEVTGLINEAAPLLPDDEVLLPGDTEGRDLALWFQTPISYYVAGEVREGYVIRENWEINMILITHVSLDDRDEQFAWVGESGKEGVWITLYGRCVSVKEGTVVNEIQYPATGYASLANEHGMPGDSIAISFRTPLTDHFSQSPWVVDMIRWMIALYRLMGDHIVRSAGRASRPQLKRIQRLGFPPNGYLTEFQLRRVDYEGQRDDSGTPLRFRHRVRGHWRKFYCPTVGEVGNPDAYRYKYVEDYVRGPKGTPFIDSTRVITVKR
jgi:hypothetical protein